MSSPSISETIGELRDLLFDIRRQAEDTGYGIFPGGDPRTFTPDPEASTEAERAAWKTDCERVERGKDPLTKTACEFIPLGVSGVAIKSRPGYGLGTYTMDDPQAAEWAERLERHINALESWATEDD